jgi:hypothetical protein
MNGVRRRSPLVTPAVAAVLVALIAIVAACSGATGEGNASSDAPSLVETGPPTVTAVGMGSTVPTSSPGTAGPPTTAPPSASCALAATVAEEDVAIALLTATAGDEPGDEPEATAADHRRALIDALTGLASARSRLAGPAAAVIESGLAPRGPGGRRPGPVEALHVAMLRECGIRLAGSGALRPDIDPDDGLDRLGLARIIGAPCDVAQTLRWADAHWRAAPNGGEQDRLGVVVRHALDALRLDGVAIDLPADIGRADLAGWSLSSAHSLAMVRLDADLRRSCDQRLEAERTAHGGVQHAQRRAARGARSTRLGCARRRRSRHLAFALVRDRRRHLRPRSELGDR